MCKKEHALNGWAFRRKKDGILYVVNEKPERGADGDWVLSESIRPIGFGWDEALPQISPESDAIEVELVVRMK